MKDLSEIKERVKAAVNLVDYIMDSGVSLTGGPVEFKACCPFHQEKTPSFAVNKEKQLFHCFGCGAGGDLIDYVMRTKGLDFLGALKLLANSVGISLPERRIYQPPEAKVSVREGLGRGAIDPEKFRPLVPGGMVSKYLTEERKLDAAKLAEYSVGETVDGQAYSFAYRWWLPDMPRREGTKPRLEFVKVVKLERPQGKKVEWREPKGGRNILFGMLAVPEHAKELVIAEGEIDAITWAQYGFPAVSVPGGAGNTGWLDPCWDWLQRFEKIHISFDEDRAGRAKVVEIVQRLGIARTDIIRLPEKPDEQLPAPAGGNS